MVLPSDRDRKALVALNPFLEHPGKVESPATLIQKNRHLVRKHYGAPAYARRLQAVYSSVMARKVRQKIDKTKLLTAFLQPEQFSLLKWGPSDANS